jgi:hypothetical protein
MRRQRGVLDGSEQRVVVDLLAIAARTDVVTDDDRRYRVASAAGIFVEVTTNQLL